MTGHFDADWLTLREPADHRARAGALVRLLSDYFSSLPLLHILDLGAGTGSNLRFLAPRLSQPQRWTLIDHDPGLLERVRPPADRPDVQWRSLCADLSLWRDCVSLPAPDLVTASALIDLVSQNWAESLAEGCRALGAAVYIALSYDGEVRWSQPDPLDAQVRTAVNAHQERDKGLGSALGPRATSVLASQLRDRGYRVRTDASPWNLGADSAALAGLLVTGWVDAACEQDPGSCALYQMWGERRQADLAAGRTRVHVGHWDLLALPESAP
jgi:SAM-dependent methyltransferase